MLIFSARVTDKANVNIDARIVGKDRWAAANNRPVLPIVFVPTLLKAQTASGGLMVVVNG